MKRCGQLQFSARISGSPTKQRGHRVVFRVHFVAKWFIHGQVCVRMHACDSGDSGSTNRKLIASHQIKECVTSLTISSSLPPTPGTSLKHTWYHMWNDENAALPWRHFYICGWCNGAGESGLPCSGSKVPFDIRNWYVHHMLWNHVVIVTCMCTMAWQSMVGDFIFQPMTVLGGMASHKFMIIIYFIHITSFNTFLLN